MYNDAPAILQEMLHGVAFQGYGTNTIYTQGGGKTRKLALLCPEADMWLPLLGEDFRGGICHDYR